MRTTTASTTTNPGCGRGGRGGRVGPAAVLTLLSLFLAAVAGPARADDPSPAPPPKKDGPAAPAAAPTPDPAIVLREGLRLPAVGSKKPTAIHRDPVEARLVRGTWAPPKAGETVVAADGETKTWAAAKANEKGGIRGRRLHGGHVRLAAVRESGRAGRAAPRRRARLRLRERRDAAGRPVRQRVAARAGRRAQGRERVPLPRVEGPARRGTRGRLRRTSTSLRTTRRCPTRRACRSDPPASSS